jgi:hypothetical protein
MGIIANMLSKNWLLAALVAIGAKPTNAQASTSAVKQMDIIYRAGNMTAAHIMPGYNHSMPYPGVPVEDWKLSLSVIDQVVKNRTDYFTAYAITYRPPDSLIDLPIDPSWNVCGSHWWLEVELGDQKAIDPRCRGILSDSCQEALEEAVRTSEFCSSVSLLPKECGGDFADAIKMGLNDRSQNGGIIYRVRGHEPGNFTLYDLLARKVLVTLVGYGPSLSEEELDPSKNERVPGIFSCLRTTDVHEGSRNPWEEQKKKDSPNDESEGQPEGDDKGDDKPKDGAASNLRSSIGYIVSLAIAAVIMSVL